MDDGTNYLAEFENDVTLLERVNLKKLCGTENHRALPSSRGIAVVVVNSQLVICYFVAEMLRCITVNATKWAKVVNCCQQMMSSEIRHQSPSSGDLSEVGEYSEEELKLLTEKWSRCCTFLFCFLLSCSTLTTILYVLI